MKSSPKKFCERKTWQENKIWLLLSGEQIQKRWLSGRAYVPTHSPHLIPSPVGGSGIASATKDSSLTDTLKSCFQTRSQYWARWTNSSTPFTRTAPLGKVPVTVASDSYINEQWFPNKVQVALYTLSRGTKVSATKWLSVVNATPVFKRPGDPTLHKEAELDALQIDTDALVARALSHSNRIVSITMDSSRHIFFDTWVCFITEFKKCKSVLSLKGIHLLLWMTENSPWVILVNDMQIFLSLFL